MPSSRTDADGAPVASIDHVDGTWCAPVLVHLTRVCAHRSQQRDLDRQPGRVPSGVQDAGVRVRGFEPAASSPSCGPVELDAPTRSGRAPRRGPSEQSTLDRARVAQPGAGDEGVGDVRGDAVVAASNDGDAALGVPGVALRERPPW